MLQSVIKCASDEQKKSSKDLIHRWKAHNPRAINSNLACKASEQKNESLAEKRSFAIKRHKLMTSESAHI